MPPLSKKECAENARRVSFSQLTNMAESIESQGDSWSEIQVEVKLSMLEKYFDRFEHSQTTLDELNGAPEYEQRARFEQIFMSVKERLLVLRNSIFSSSTPMASTSDLDQFPRGGRMKSVLPTIQVPKFDGSYAKWSDFINLFRTMIDEDATLTDTQKFQYLKSALDGPAVTVIQSLECTPDNYKRALELLNNRYENKRLLFCSHISKLMNITPINRGAATNLRQIVDILHGETRALESLANKSQIADGLLINIISAKLDNQTRAKWEEFAPLQELPTWTSFVNFLDSHCKKLEHVQGSSTLGQSGPNDRKRDHSGKLVAHVTSAKFKSRQFCFCCRSSDHWITQCPSFLKLSSRERYNWARKFALCLNCLRSGHLARDCRSPHCSACKLAHHATLHFVRSVNEGDSRDNQGSSSDRSVSDTKADKTRPQEGTTAANCYHIGSSSTDNSNVIIATALVNAVATNGLRLSCRVLLDSASQLNLITRNLSQRLGLKKIGQNAIVSGVGDLETQVMGRVGLTIDSQHTSFRLSTHAFVMQNITPEQPSTMIVTDNWSLPGNVTLADPKFHIPAKVDILLGAEWFFRLLCVGQINLGHSRPILQKSVFGWLVSGAVDHPVEICSDVRSLVMSVSRSSEGDDNFDILNDQLKRFWQLEEVKSTKKVLSTDDEMCETMFQQTTTRDDNGRFIVRLPFKWNPEIELGESRTFAEVRLVHVERKLARDASLKEQYINFMTQYEDLRHMKLSQTGVGSRAFFMPHHGVEQWSGASKKLRVVFDASCKTTSGKSLNDVLLSGPTVQEELFSILCRYRMFKFVMSADIIKMFRQIWIHPDDAPYQSILWRRSSNESMSEFQLSTVTYGTACAPYLSTRCLLELSRIYQNEFPLGSTILRQDVYVDDILTGADNIDLLLEKRNQLVEILSRAGMQLHKWSSNVNGIIQLTPSESQQPMVLFDDALTTKTLGMLWQPREDRLRFTFGGKLNKSRLTKRVVLSTIASFYDPLGLINPVIVMAKIFMQELWKLSVHWDESLPQEFVTRWEQFTSQLPEIDRIQIDRCLSPYPGARLQIHGFCDASQLAYGACIYLRATTADETHVNIICSKSRVSPIKTQSIPRLELCAALLLVDLMNKVIESIHFHEGDKRELFCWTDSSIVLSWISKPASTWKTFVANRVSRIQEFTETNSVKWKHVRSECNPADVLSRGATPTMLRTHPLWFHGPPFLKSGSEDWPSFSITQCTPGEERVSRSSSLLLTDKIDFISNLKYVNNYKSLVRIFAYVHRFIRAIKKKRLPRASLELDPSDLIMGESLIIKAIQTSFYKHEISKLSQSLQVHKSSKLLSLNPFLDDEGLIRVGGRLGNSNVCFDNKHQILLPHNHPFTTSLVRNLHKKNLHAGCLTLQSIVRQRYWIPGGRSLIRRVIHNCIICFRSKPIVSQQLMGHLPSERVEPTHPFSRSGVDFAGPFILKQFGRGRVQLKAYVALFICLVTKAVHLELVTDLSTDTFIAALKRFISRRGRCESIISDNATNFTGASRKLSELREFVMEQLKTDKLKVFCLDEGMKWSFIPPRSPHFGGLWEASVKKAKFHMTRILGNHPLNFEEFNTILIQIEAVINSRPLTPISSDPNDFEVLTPAHFLIGRPLLAIPEPSLKHIQTNRLSRWQFLTRIHQDFWNRWSVEYLSSLQERNKWKNTQKNVPDGAVVLLKEDNTPPNKWYVGRVVKTISDPEGRVRVADVKTASGTYRRAITKLCILPLEDQ